MDLLGMFAKTLLGSDEIPLGGNIRPEAEPRPAEFMSRPSDFFRLSKRRRRVRAPLVDYRHISEKVSDSVARHIARLAKRRQDDLDRSLRNYQSLPPYGFRAATTASRYLTSQHRVVVHKGQEFQPLALGQSEYPGQNAWQSRYARGRREGKPLRRAGGRTDLSVAGAEKLRRNVRGPRSAALPSPSTTPSQLNSDRGDNPTTNRSITVMRHVRRIQKQAAAAAKALDRIDSSLEKVSAKKKKGKKGKEKSDKKKTKKSEKGIKWDGDKERKKKPKRIHSEA